MAQNNENTLLQERIMEYRGLSYEKIKAKVLENSKTDLSSEAAAQRIRTIRIEMRMLRQETTLTPDQFLMPFTI